MPASRIPYPASSTRPSRKQFDSARLACYLDCVNRTKNLLLSEALLLASAAVGF